MTKTRRVFFFCSDKSWTSLYLILAMVLWYMGVLHVLVAVSMVCVLLGSGTYTKILISMFTRIGGFGRQEKYHLVRMIKTDKG